MASRESKAAALGVPGAAPLPPITNIVFMGMGEPLHNLSAVMSAVDILCDSTGLQFSHNKVRPVLCGAVFHVRHHFCEGVFEVYHSVKGLVTLQLRL